MVPGSACRSAIVTAAGISYKAVGRGEVGCEFDSDVRERNPSADDRCRSSGVPPPRRCPPTSGIHVIGEDRSAAILVRSVPEFRRPIIMAISNSGIRWARADMPSALMAGVLADGVAARWPARNMRML